jgi:hypothetical protein
VETSCKYITANNITILPGPYSTLLEYAC